MLPQLGEDFPFMAWVHDADGTLLAANRAWRTATGLGPGAGTMPQIWQRLLPAYDLVRHLGAFGAALRAGMPYAFEHRLAPERAGAGEYRWFVSRAVPVRDGGERGMVWVGTTVALPDPGPRGPEAVEGMNAAARAVEPAALVPLPRVAGLRLDAAYTAAGPAAIGGDWYDAFALDDGRLVLSVGDVAGHGERAALAMVALRNALRGAALACPAPVAVLAAGHAALALEGPERLATALAALYEPRTRLLSYARAGHPPALLYDGAAVVELSARPRLPLGCPDPFAAELRTVRLPPGAVVLFYTDGLVESGGDAEAGYRCLLAALADPACRDAARPALALRDAVLERPGRADDVALLVLTVELDGPQEPW